jgi:ribosomal protein L37E
VQSTVTVRKKNKQQRVIICHQGGSGTFHSSTRSVSSTGIPLKAGTYYEMQCQENKIIFTNEQSLTKRKLKKLINQKTKQTGEEIASLFSH